MEFMSGPQLLFGFKVLQIFLRIDGVTCVKLKMLSVGGPKYSVKCLLLSGIASASSGPIPEKKSLNPFVISLKVVRIFPFDLKKDGRL